MVDRWPNHAQSRIVAAYDWLSRNSISSLRVPYTPPRWRQSLQDTTVQVPVLTSAPIVAWLFTSFSWRSTCCRWGWGAGLRSKPRLGASAVSNLSPVLRELLVFSCSLPVAQSLCAALPCGLVTDWWIDAAGTCRNPAGKLSLGSHTSWHVGYAVTACLTYKRPWLTKAISSVTWGVTADRGQQLGAVRFSPST